MNPAIEASLRMLRESSSNDQDNLFNSESLAKWVEDFGRIGCTPEGGVTRLAFSKEDIAARKKLSTLMQDELHLSVRVDAWGNLYGRLPGRDGKAPPIRTGSHLDSVPNGGKFDGPAGIFCGLKALQILQEKGIVTDHPLELVVFSAEEPYHSGMSTIGSRGVAGRLRAEDLVERKDDQQVDLMKALRRVGGDPSALGTSLWSDSDCRAFIEIHIEQMPYLEQSGRELAVVTGVTGIERLKIVIDGRPDHSGTTPMSHRRDALLAASGLIQKVNSLAQATDGQAVATVGQVEVSPNAVNVVPGQASLDVEIRSYFQDEVQNLLQALKAEAQLIEAKTGVIMSLQEGIYHTEPVSFSSGVRRAIHQACEYWNCSTLDLVSMAGHDAAHIASVAPTGMIFVPSFKGMSHCPEEWTDPADLARAARVLAAAIIHIDKETEPL